MMRKLWNSCLEKGEREANTKHVRTKQNPKTNNQTNFKPEYDRNSGIET